VDSETDKAETKLVIVKPQPAKVVNEEEGPAKKEAKP